MSDYTPIDCGLHSEYELSIMQNRRLRISWRDRDGQHRIAVLKPRDLVTHDHEEFLVVKNLRGQQQEIRLDYIAQMKIIQKSRSGG